MLIALTALFGGGQLLPLRSVGFTEGFQLMVLNLAAEHAAGCGPVADLAFPLAAQFYYVTRFGLIAILAALDPLMVADPLPMVAALMIASLATYLAATAILIRRLFDAGPGWTLLAAAMCPAITASAYYLNDSLPSAALAVTALALFAGASSWPRTIVTGVLLGLGAVLRIDALFVWPILLMIALAAGNGWRRALKQGLAAAITATATASACYLAGGLSILDPLRIGQAMITLWMPQVSSFHAAAIIVVAVTLPLVIAALAGAWRLWRDNGAGHSRLLIAVVGLGSYLLIYNLSLYQPRYLLPVLPLVLGLAATGLRDAFTRPRIVGVAAAILLATLQWFAPYVAIASEGPRAVTGQMWNTLDWTRWLAQITKGTRITTTQLNSVLRLGGPRQTIVTVGWSEERLTVLALERGGFVATTPERQDFCALIGQKWIDSAGRMVRHVRLEIPFTGAQPRDLDRLLVNRCWARWGGHPSHAIIIDAAPAAPAWHWARPGISYWIPRLRIAAPAAAIPIDGPSSSPAALSMLTKATQPDGRLLQPYPLSFDGTSLAAPAAGRACLLRPRMPWQKPS
ncbi:hypothetical protein [Sphingomonas sp. MA1305]|uniref:hypothetical protein n=1 Tax=Sphingomonas sp. MA1305 TaxID=2479204 RepID=UPI0018E043A2|nr:hypothetical protein [Sphingomonas sp. MA1305]